jgi:hypothetical protein
MASFRERMVVVLAVGVLVSACATRPTDPTTALDSSPWWESAGPCRVWVPIHPAPGAGPVAWDPSPSTTRMSRPGDCRSLQAALPDGAVLIGAP